MTSQPAPTAFLISTTLVLGILQAARGEAHQFWLNGKVPVGICHVAVPQKRRQHRQTPLDIFVGPIPLDQRADGESVPKIVKPWPLVIVRSAQADLPRQIVECSTNRRALQTAAVIVEKETGRRWTA